MADEEPQTSFLDLPDPCLLAVLQCLADDQASLCSAARAHSRLHQTAVVALSSFRAAIQDQEQISDSLVPYMSKYGQHVSSMQLVEAGEWLLDKRLRLRQLPSNVQITSLDVNGFNLQLQPGDGFEGVLGPAARGLRQLRIANCSLLDGGESLAAALSLLLELEHLTVSSTPWAWQSCMFPTQLTYLDLQLYAPGRLVADSNLAWLHQLSRLRHLQLFIDGIKTLTADALSGQSNLTYLSLQLFHPDDDVWEPMVEADVLAGKTQLQHLDLSSCGFGRYHGDAAGLAQLLSHLQRLQQLTHLDLAWSSISIQPDDPPAAAFSALTASSKLQYLNISGSKLPEGVWQHMFPADRHLPYLQSLDISSVNQPIEDPDGLGRRLSPPEGTRLVSCCPALQLLDLSDLPYAPELMVQLTGLKNLQTLFLTVPAASEQHALECICRLTGLRKLNAGFDRDPVDGLLLQLTQLRHLTELHWSWSFGQHIVDICDKGGEPVWR